MEYERLTERRKYSTGIYVEKLNGEKKWQDAFDLVEKERSGLIDEVFDRLAELEDKIEQGNIIIPKFARNQEVYYIEYVAHAYNCPHCGEECYEEEVKGVAKGIICERRITDNQDGMDIWYTIQIEEKGKLKMFTKREEKEVFLTREEAEKRLEELKE